ncbi:MAG: TOMM precursor leader peptide-binding protein [Anaerolineae bacterium]|nr:TOMM precursor leader peptide-binding protein [Anaerolineae bacterium]
MTQRPRFKPYFRCEIIPSEGIFLLSEKKQFLLQGAAYLKLAPLLTGQYTIDEIMAELKGQISPAEVFYALEMLRREGYIVDSTPPMPSEQAAFWGMLGVAAEHAARQLQRRTISLTAFGQVDPAPLKAMLESVGVGCRDDGEVSVVLTDDYLQPGLETFNRAALLHQRPWLLVKPVGAEVWIGPIFIPGQTGCWACLADRLRGQRKVESYLERKQSLSGPLVTSLAVLPSTRQTALGLAATEVAKWMVLEQNEALTGRIIALNTLSLEMQSHLLTRRPQCPRCGNPKLVSRQQSASLKLQSQQKGYTSDGGHRHCSPEETFQRLAHHLSQITGIVGGLHPITLEGDKNGLIPGYIADHNFALLNNNLDALRENLRAQSGGKGKRDIQAKVSALGESIERYSGVFQGDEARIQASFKELGDAAIHPNACMLFSERQLAKQEQPVNGSPFRWVPTRFDETREIEWSPVWSLTSGETRYVPTAYCYYGYSRIYQTDFTRADSNGCAAGNTNEEAILQGFMELVERDSVALWWYNRLKKPVVDLASFDEPYFQQLPAYYKTLQRDLWVLDLTSDLNIPTFAAISRRTSHKTEDIIFGFGAHFDPQLAVLRALTELNQSLPSVVAAQPAKENYRILNPDAFAWWQTATLENQPYLTPDKTLAPKVPADYPQSWEDDLYLDVMNCVRIASDKGLETLVLDQTRPDLGLQVVKVIVPGLRHYWARFGPGRLYDVPVQMGYRQEPLSEEQLNPHVVYF